MQQNNRASLSAAGCLSDRWLRGVEGSINLSDLVWGSSLGGRLEELRGRSVLVATKAQLTAALALIELDGIARRLVLCPPDLSPPHFPTVLSTAAVDAVVSDGFESEAMVPGVGCVVTCSPAIVRAGSDRSVTERTEWVLLTSGTTGVPKMTLHTL